MENDDAIRSWAALATDHAKNIRRMELTEAVVEAARVLLKTPDPADLDTISLAIVGLNAALNNLDKC